MSLINFDNNATTKLCPEALEVMSEAYQFSYNPSANHSLGRQAAMIVENARMNVSEALNASNYEIFFTGGGTEANNMALFSDKYDKIFFAKIEHSSVYNVRPKNTEIIDIAIDENGVIDVKKLEEELCTVDTANFLVSVIFANSEAGIIQPIKEIAKLVHQKGGLIHSDMVQACGKIKIDLEDLNVDFATISAHKINGPQGVGAILVRRGLEIEPIIFGGGQERGKRSGTLNVAGITALGHCITKLDEKIAKMTEIGKIRDYIEDEVTKIAGDNVKFFGKKAPRVQNTSFFAVRNGDSQTQLIHFDLNGIMVSGGSACSSGSTKPPKILEAMNVTDDFKGALRVSLNSDNNMIEAKKFIDIFEQYYQKISKNY